MNHFLITWYNQEENSIGSLNLRTTNDKAEVLHEYRRTYGDEASCDVVELTCKAEISEYEWADLL